MSLILDALNRSRHDTDAVPGLGSEHFADSPEHFAGSPERVRRYLPWIALLLAVLIIAWLLLGGDSESTGQAGDDKGVVAPVAQLSQNIGSAASSFTNELKSRAEAAREKVRAETQMAAPAATVAALPAPAVPQQEGVMQEVPAAKPAALQPVTDATPSLPSTSGAPSTDRAALEALYARSRQPQEKTPAPRRPDSAAMASAVERSSAAPKARMPAPAATASRREEAVDVEEVLRLAQEEVANAKLVEHPAPFLVRLSQQFKNDIPSIMYQRHDYSSTPNQSKVMLNGKDLRVGGAPLNGMRVDEILEDSVVLTYRGSQFRLRALNSWVNL